MKGTTICNRCGAPFTVFDEDHEFSFYRALGYGMGEYDGDELQLDLCCDCMKELINECNISPIIHRNCGFEMPEGDGDLI